MGPTHPPPPPSTTSPGGHTGGVNKQPPSHQKIRLMISYGGHILPRPHDKTLFYAGGETRIISTTRTTALSLSSLFPHISKSLFNTWSHSFLLKYQLPHHDLDSLISISSDEDLVNMMDEFDRLGSNGRIRFFVFGDGEGGCGGGVDDDWFVDALKVTGSSLEDGGLLHETIVLESSSSFGSTNSSNSPGNNNININNINISTNNKGGGDEFKGVLPSVDSLGSDTSLPSPNFSQQAIVYQDASGFVDSKVAVNLVETENSVSDRSPQSDSLTPVQVSGYIISKPSVDQPQYPSPSPPPPPPARYFYHTGSASQANYVPQYYPSSIPVAYTPMYQTYVQPPQHFQYQLNKPYPVYMMPVGQTQNLYDTSSMHGLTTTTPTVSSSQSQVASNPVVVASPMVYEGYKPTTTGPEYAPKVHGQASVATYPMTLPPAVMQPSQPVSVTPLENANYTSDYEDPMHAQIYKTQPSAPTLSSQLQMLPESFAQLQVENGKH